MSWIEKLYRTYENNLDNIGNPKDPTPLLPVSHTTQNAHVQIVIDGQSNFIRASVISKSDAKTIIPATEEAAGRAGSKPACFPLCDKLQYIAGDFVKFGGRVTSGFAAKPHEPHDNYLTLLSGWCESSFSQPKISAVLEYVKRGKVVSDLVGAIILHVNDGRLITEWNGLASEMPEIFKVIQSGGGQSDAFVRFSVECPGDPQTALWTDSTAWESWASYYASQKSLKGLCYVAGEEDFLADQHPAKIRNSGDKAKLISSNDSSGFTFRGRFVLSDEACGVGFRVTQKAHSALRWLIARQGRRDGDQAVVAWAVSGADVPDPQADTFSFLFGDDQQTPAPKGGYTAQQVGIALSNKIAGYASKLKSTDDVVVMGLDAATPGRMAISYYRELTGSELLARVQAWHEGCAWQQRFGKERVFVGAPAPRDIAETAYGKRDEKLRKATVERLLPCIIDGAPIPRDLVESCINRASNKNGIDEWEWEKALGIACALYRYHYKERGYQMALDRDRKTRNYLYGRLLALAEHMENRALFVGGEKRATNAEKLMQRFAERPQSTWLILETGLTPYKVRLSAKRPSFLHSVKQEIDDVIAAFETDEFISDKRLTGEFLLGYHCQRAALRPDQTQNIADMEDENEE
ncbi:MAG: type I-C CRISPR-associated protein Cas8c/Csd1 [Verrucomicrobia bacterium]|nr:type I-C CRISPR-associated protein Cas8c/Csd1 [Deltaproteobacteria bacterium]